MSEELDVEQLRSELETIKDAMGIQERYPTQFRVWLVYGVLVALASVGSQAVVMQELPWWGHWLSWGGFMTAGGIYQAVAVDDRTSSQTGAAKPDLRLVYLSVFGYALVVLSFLSPLLEGVESAVASSTIFALFVGAVGLAYLVAGNLLQAYYIRKRDRLAFYVGGVWMLGFAGLLPQFALLRQWGYALFGIAFGLHAIGSYIVLARA